jgi:serine/threonine-protein kinase
VTRRNLSLLPAAVSPHVRATLQSCLEKEVRRRWRSMGDVQLLLDGQFDIGSGAEAARRSASAPRIRLMAAAVVALGMTTALAVGALMLRRPAAVRPLTRLGLSLPGGATVRDLTITPDGSKVVYVGDRGRRIYVRSLDALEPVEIASGVILAQLAISPNGQWVSFIDGSTRLRKVPISGGPSSAIANLDGGARGVAWLTDDTLVVGTAARTGLLRVSASGAEPPTAITTLDDSGVDHVWPERLPGGQALLFGMEGATSGDDNRHVAALDMASGRVKIVVRGGGRPRFVVGGFLAYGARGKTFAVPFRLDDLEVPAGATPLDLEFPPGPFAVSADGTLVLGNSNGADRTDQLHTIVWVDRSGRETPIAAPARRYQYPQISPDGARVAVSALGEMADLWIWNLASATQTRLTLEPSTEATPLWTPDGKRLVFASNRADGVFNIWWQAADGTGSAERLTASPFAVFPTSVSPDGQQVVYWAATPTDGRDLMMIALDGSRRVTALLQTPADEWSGTISPDGRWLAYESNGSGQPDVYVRPFPRMDQGQWQVSMAGGRQRLWFRDGTELFFFSLEGEFMRMRVSAEAGRFGVGTPDRLFEHRYGSDPAGLVARSYDVSPDGQRFLLLKSASGSDTPATAPDVVLVQNWAEDLKRVMDRK